MIELHGPSYNCDTMIVMKICEETNCKKPYAARGYCDSHYRQYKKTGGLKESLHKPRPAIKTGHGRAAIPVGVGAKNGYAIIDESDMELASQYLWSISKGYAVTNVKYKHLHLHHLIAGKPPKGMVTDHINRNTLDNRRSNLRFVTQHINSLNTGDYSHNTSGVRGVCWEKRRNKWVARMHINRKEVFLGYFDNKEDAAKARKEAWEAHVKSVTIPG